MSFELGNDGPKTILVGLDGSRTSMRAGAYAAGLARRQQSQLIVVHVASPSALAGMSAGLSNAYDQSLRQLSAELREEVLAGAESIGLQVEFVSVAGEAYDQIARLAEERRVDAVVVGASEKAGHRLVGSLATRLVRAARWPVTVVP